MAIGQTTSSLKLSATRDHTYWAAVGKWLWKVGSYILGRVEQTWGRGDTLLDMSMLLFPGHLTTPGLPSGVALDMNPLARLAMPPQNSIWLRGILEQWLCWASIILAVLPSDITIAVSTLQQLQLPPPCSNCSSLNCTPCTELSTLGGRLWVPLNPILGSISAKNLHSVRVVPWGELIVSLYCTRIEVSVTPTSPPLQASGFVEEYLAICSWRDTPYALARTAARVMSDLVISVHISLAYGYLSNSCGFLF